MKMTEGYQKFLSSLLDTRRDSRIARIQIINNQLVEKTGGLSDSKRRRRTNNESKDNDDDEFELQGSSSFCVTIRFSTKPMTNDNNN